MKKLFTAILALVLVFSLSAVALAEGDLLDTIRERGYLREGYYADITVFDEAAIRAAVPDQEKSFGIEKVFVNGKMILDGEQIDRAAAAHSGRAIRVLT